MMVKLMIPVARYPESVGVGREGESAAEGEGEC